MVRVKTFYNLTPLYLSRLPLVLSLFVPFVDDTGTSGSPAPLSWFLLFRLLTTLPPHLPSPMSNVLVPEQVQPLLCILLTDVCSFHSPQARGPGCSPLLSGHPVPGLPCRWPTNVCRKKGRGGAPKANLLLGSFAERLGQFPVRTRVEVRAARPSLADGLPLGVLVWGLEC